MFCMKYIPSGHLVFIFGQPRGESFPSWSFLPACRTHRVPTYPWFFLGQWAIFILNAWFTIFRPQGPLNPYIFWKLMMSAINIRTKIQTQRKRRLQRQRQRHQENNWNNISMLYFKNRQMQMIIHSTDLLQMIILMDWTLANDHLIGPASCKWSSWSIGL